MAPSPAVRISGCMPLPSACPRKCRRPLALAALAAVLLAAAFLAAHPTAAFAKSYRMPAVDIQATLDDQGTLEVTERRTFDFDGAFTCVWWEFDSFGYRSEMTVESVAIELGGQRLTLAPVEFRPSWRNSGGPGIASYAVDEAYDGVYVFFDADSEQMEVELRYRVEPMATCYDDVAELYWQ